MQPERVFKKRYILVPLLFSLAYAGWFLYFMNFPVEQDLRSKVKVNSWAVLYVTQANAGAMTSFTYHYYLSDAKKNEADFLSHIDQATPFMVTNDPDVIISVKDDGIYLRVRGDVYSFHNTSKLANILLDASPY
ncbi:hypothetical protein BWZ29_14965 [Enterobacter cancerogenus]|uniref:hypothetical protein n=1 Tax=Enterobacter chuandaensis TaxID=2497875 RepID=UPI0009C5AA77|nr:hypothetical protein [Enterobacter chuandaensis]OQD48295.1 hypothetical protein BWZ29_14965 [Enterobacter cancerogenus]